MDQRPKLYALRTTWDDVFEPRILYDLDIKVNISKFIFINRMIIQMFIAMTYADFQIKTIDCNWPVRVNRTRDTRDSSSDEFSSDSRSDEERPKRSKLNSNGRKMSEHVLTSGQTGGTYIDEPYLGKYSQQHFEQINCRKFTKTKISAAI